MHEVMCLILLMHSAVTQEHSLKNVKAIPPPSFCSFGIAIPTCLYILEKCFLYLMKAIKRCTFCSHGYVFQCVV